MKQQILYALPLLSAVVARPAAFVSKREVPQEHAHQDIIDIVDTLLQANNPDNIKSSVFGLLGAAAAAGGAGNIADADCLQQATADQAFTNAKKAGDVDGQTAALIFRALERNSGSVGLASVPCQSIKAVNPEIAALQQHQDPASDGAQELNKQIASELARQIASIGGDPTRANEASTFAPGQIGDPTAKGNTCDVADDKAGCINSQNLRVDDLSAAEIQAAVGGAAAGNANAGNANAGNNNTGNGNAGSNNAGNDNAGNNNADDECDDANAGAGNAGTVGNAQAGNAGNAADAGNAKGGNSGNANANNGNANAGNSANNGKQAGAGAGASAFGGCNLAISFGIPSDGRKEDAFEAVDLATFNHGSALNIGVISDFICSQLSNKCNTDAAAQDQCDAASTAAKALKGQAAADSFNSALGF